MACVSLEPWDTTWRRNQHLAARLVRQGLASRLLFVEPPVLGQRRHRWCPEPGVEVLRPALLGPKRAGGLRATGLTLRSTVLRGVDLLWLNDPQLARHCLTPGRRTVYDVTDDWRTFVQPPHIIKRIVDAEDRLAGSVATVVCSQVLADRWKDRYGVVAPVVPNAVDLDAYAAARTLNPPGRSPHLGYVGTLQSQRLDVALVLAVADATEGTVHLIGPNALDDADAEALTAHPQVRMHGPVPAPEVPGWMKGLEVLLCPHRVDAFTLSLDAIKLHEYLASTRPIVATPTSGFQSVSAPGLVVVRREDFVQAALRAVGTPVPRRDVVGWDERTREFAAVLAAT